MFDDICKCYAFLGVYYKDFLEEVFNIGVDLFELLLAGDYICDVEVRTAAAKNICLHIVACIKGYEPLKGYSANSMK